MTVPLNARVKGLWARWSHHRNNQRVMRIAKTVSKAAPEPSQKTVVVFNASTRIGGLSLNAGFALLTGWMLRLAGCRVINFVCDRGMSACVLGTSRDDYELPMPCASCTWQSAALAASTETNWFGFSTAEAMANQLAHATLAQLQEFSYGGVELGKLVLPSIRWVLRRHNLIENEATLALYRRYILSAWNVRREFLELLAEIAVDEVVVFNGMFFPEAVVRDVCRQKHIPCVSHEVGLMPLTGYFTRGDATAYPINIPPEFELSAEKNKQLDEYLARRFQGDFSMAGIQFWPEMEPLADAFWQKASQFRQIVPVFTNVIFDTSQSHANVLFDDMFAWLDEVKKLIERHPDTYFVVRAHPDENRAGKASQESVSAWAAAADLESLPNVLFVPPDQRFSSYELINKSRMVMVYNSTIGLEAVLLGKPVLCAGKARFTQIPTVFFPASRDEYLALAEEMLSGNEPIAVPEAFKRNARAFLFYQLYKTSLPFSDFLTEDGIWPGYVRLRDFDLTALKAENSATAKTLVDGILHGEEFILA